MTQTLQQLGEEYLLQSKRINARIRQLTAQRRTAPTSELRTLEQRIATLYEEHGSLKKTGGYLIDYYRKSRMQSS